MALTSRFFTKLKWAIFPGSSRREKEEARDFGEILSTILPSPQRTKKEEAEFEAALEQSYLQDVSIPLLKSEALRVTNDEKWKKVILSLRNLPVQFRVKFIESAQVTSWQPQLEQGVYDSHFIFPTHGSITYEEIEWLELNADKLSAKELEHFGKAMHETRIAQCHVLPLSMQIRRLYGYYKLEEGIYHSW